ncbi:RING finger protein nhl-1-like [Anopheles marshallii]|uniref:RING finger protein nhl-1-like n=1 Tax=Anopheles marshallii TaxID=1521116 RepID=UPI00237A1512|nr:RING finger protein nhl-1-like [Anopheles marshallii]
MSRSIRSSRLISYDDTARSPPMAVPNRSRNTEGSSYRNSYDASHKRDHMSKTIEQLLICGICELRLNVPKMLNCQHTFCLECLEESIHKQTDKTYIGCITCGTKQLLKDPDLTVLPSNLHIDNMLLMMNPAPTRPSSLIRTTVGSYQLENSLAPTLQCSKCQTVSETSLHKCDHCMSMLCAICWLAHVDELSRQLGQLEGQLKSAIEKLDHKMIEYKSRFSEINVEITDCFRDKILALQQQQTELLDSSQGILNDAVCSHEMVRAKIDQLMVSIGRPIVGSLDPVQVYLKLHKDLSIVLEEVSLWGRERVIFNREKLKVESIFDTQPVPTIKPSTSVKPSVKHQLHPNSSETSVIQFYKTHVYKPRLLWNHCQRPTGVGFAPWNHEELKKPLLYVAGSECRIVFGIDKTNGHIVQKISHEELSYPQGITFDPDRKELLVTDKWKHCIFVFSQEGQLLRKLCSKGDQAGQLRSPEGIAFCSSETIFVCDTGNDRIQCLSTNDGKAHTQFGRLTKDQLVKATQSKISSRMVDLKNPTDIAVQKDSILVLDAGNRRVKLFNKYGEQLLEFGQTGTINGQFQYPEVIGVDPAGFILVGDGGNAKVLVYRPNGQFVTALGSRGDSAGKFNWISGICVSKDWEIVISDYKNHAVQLIF